jgi:quinol monooxygenase YgiN
MKLVGALIGAGMFFAMPASWAQVSNQPAYVVTYIEVVPAARTETVDLLKQVAAASRKEPGNLRYEILQRSERNNHFAILEAWSDSKAAEAHESGNALKQFRTKLDPLRSAAYDQRPSVGVTAAPTAAPPTAKAIYAVTHVDVTPSNKDECIALLKQLAERSRKEPGAERFEAWQQSNRSNHFTVMQVWANRAAYDAHNITPVTKDFRERINPMIGALYDERLYTAVE